MAAGMYQTRAEMPPWISKELQDIYSKLAAQQYVPGGGHKEFVAGLNTNIAKALANLSSMDVDTSAYDANRKVSSEAQQPFSQNYQNYLNPYRNEVLDIISKRGMENFKNNILPEIENTFVRKGQHGSKRHADITTKAAAAAQEGISDRQAKMLASYYGQAAEQYNSERLRSLMAARQAIEGQRSLQGQQLANEAARSEAGNLEREIEQQKRNFDRESEREQRLFPERQLLTQGAFLSGVPFPQMQSHYNMGAPPQPHPGIMSNLGGLAASLLGARMAQGGR